VGGERRGEPKVGGGRAQKKGSDARGGGRMGGKRSGQWETKN